MPKRPNTRGNSARLRIGRESESYGCYAITKVVHQRRRLLAEDKTAHIVIQSLGYLREQERVKLFSFCIMPDHLHFCLCLMSGEQLSKVVADFSKFTSRRINRALGLTGRFWQEGFHDRHCRNRDELTELCGYIEHNPVRCGLTEAAEKWPHGSAAPDHRGLLDREWWP